MNVDEIIKNFISKIQENPLIIHSESDLQALLTNNLLEQDSELYETSTIFNTKRMKTHRIHREYNGHDIVIFSKKHIKDINNRKGFLYVPNNLGLVFCSHIIELKFDIHGTKSIEKKAKEDFQKLRNKYNKMLL